MYKYAIIISLISIPAAALAQGGGILSHPDLYYETVTLGLAQPTSFEFVGGDTILVLQKATGEVKVVHDNAIVATALDLPVANANEMGLLGIVRHPDFEKNGLVFIYHTKGTQDGGTWIEDRVDRYLWDATSRTLTFESNILTLGPEGWPLSPFHHGGYMKIGSDSKLYVQHGDMYTRHGTMEINDDTGVSGSNACIYRLNLDGSIPADNPFADNPIVNFQRAFVYGVRNAFGMAFDPLTGNLWYTENGPELYDEINIAPAGMNSGWHKIMGPDSRNANMVINSGQTYDEADLLQLPGSHYRDPVFSYKTPIGITFIEFLDKTRFTPELRNCVLVGSVSQAKLFLFELSKDRTDFVLAGNLADRVADTPEERDAFKIGAGWGPLTDARVGEDGCLYVLSLGLGGLYRIRTAVETVDPISATRISGVGLGELDELLLSDNEYYALRGWRGTRGGDLIVEFETVSPFDNIRKIEFESELRSTAAGVAMTCKLYNYKTGKFDSIGGANLATVDEEISIPLETNANDYLDPASNTVKTRLHFYGRSVLIRSWIALIDKASWTITRTAT
jgi:glucose/arabinose dehydrogenase